MKLLMLYGVDCCALKKRNVLRLKVTERIMEVKIKNKIGNEDVRNRTTVMISVITDYKGNKFMPNRLESLRIW